MRGLERPRLRFRNALLAGAMLVSASVPPAWALDLGPQPVWPDTYTTRLQALAVLQTLNADLLANASATLTLDRWCATHRLAPAGTTILAERVRGQDKAANAEVRALLKVGPGEPVAYRRVRLKCGERVLSEADNWYVPAWLTADMNAQLETTDISFGRVVAPLAFRRTTSSAQLLWRPLPEGWDMGAVLPWSTPRGRLVPPPFLLEHRAVLTLPDGTPFSALVETYARDVLAFPAPRERP